MWWSHVCDLPNKQFEQRISMWFECPYRLIGLPKSFIRRVYIVQLFGEFGADCTTQMDVMFIGICFSVVTIGKSYSHQYLSILLLLLWFLFQSFFVLHYIAHAVFSSLCSVKFFKHYVTFTLNVFLTYVCNETYSPLIVNWFLVRN